MDSIDSQRRGTGFSIAFRSAIFLAMVLVSPGQTLPKSFACPERLPAVEQTLRSTPEGWQAGKQTIPLWLYSITLFDGPVGEEVALAPDGRSKEGAKLVDTWELDATSPRLLWLQCRYANATITLEKALGKGFRRCKARYNPQIRVGGEPAMEDLRCE